MRLERIDEVAQAVSIGNTLEQHPTDSRVAGPVSAGRSLINAVASDNVAGDPRPFNVGKLPPLKLPKGC